MFKSKEFSLRETMKAIVCKLINIVPNENFILFVVDLYQILIEDILRQHDSASADRAAGPSDQASGKNMHGLRELRGQRGHQPPRDPRLARHAIHAVKRYVRPHFLVFRLNDLT